jgi:hypothetical protein
MSGTSPKYTGNKKHLEVLLSGSPQIWERFIKTEKALHGILSILVGEKTERSFG